MTSTLTIVSILAALTPLLVTFGARKRLAPTSLRLAWNWCLFAASALPALWLTTAVLPRAAPAWADIAWYGMAILLLCPLIAVLGARRPVVAAWNWFVIVPLVAVLGWPAVALLIAGARPESFTLEAPPLAGVLLVLIMGTGNFAATRYLIPVALVFAAVAVLVLSLAPWTGFPLTTASARLLAVWLLAAAAVAAQILSRRNGVRSFGPDRVWCDFRDQFGIVWAHRIRERVNERAIHEQWPVRLERAGFVPVEQAGTTPDEPMLQQIDHTLRWLLRRFVDDAWLNERLGTTPSDAASLQVEPP